MATAQMLRPKEKTNTWSKVFPNETVTEQQSALFMKKLLAIAISNITYLRAIFPEHAFGDRCLEDLNLKILRDDSSCPGACQMIKWVKGCFDALDKKYLKTMLIGIYTDPDDDETVIESYTFKFSYTENGCMEMYRNKEQISRATTEETKMATIRLLRTLVILTQSIQSLPDDVMMTIKLLYYDDVTPVDYEPPGFKPADSSNFRFEEEPLNIKAGDVETPFHMVKLRFKTSAKQFKMDADRIGDQEENVDGIPHEQERESQPKCPAWNPLNTNVEDHSMDTSQDVCTGTNKEEAEALGKRHGGLQEVREPTEALVPLEALASAVSVAEQGVDTTGSQAMDSLGQSEGAGIRCGCGSNEDDGLMILCNHCQYWAHGVCYKILNEDQAPAIHICERCAEPANLIPTDPHLLGMSEIAVQATCLWRRALVAVSEMARVPPPNLARRLGVEMSVTQGLIARLEKEGYVKSNQRAKRIGKIVEKEKIMNEGFRKYFNQEYKVPKNNAETVAPEKHSSTNHGQGKDHAVADKEESVAAEKPTSINHGQGKDHVADKEMDRLTSLAEDIDITGHGKKTRNSKSLVSSKEQSGRRTKAGTHSSDCHSTNSQSKRKVKSLSDEHEFEISNSQSLSQDQAPCAKKRKISRVSHDLRV